MNEPEPKKALRSMDDILADIDAISSDPEHRDQFKALKMLASTKSSAVVLQPPLEDGEIVDRLVRVMKPAGPNLCQMAYRRAFRLNRDSIADMPHVGFEHLPVESQDIIAKVRSLKSLYRQFPEIKRPGVPAGFPTGKGMHVQSEWCKQQAAKILLDREKKKMAEPVENGQTA